MTKKFLSAPHQINVEPILQEYPSKACRLVNQPVSAQPSCSRNLCGWNGLVFWKVLVSAASPSPLGARLSPALADLPTHGLPGESHTGLGTPHLLRPYPKCHFPILPFLRGSRSPISPPLHQTLCKLPPWDREMETPWGVGHWGKEGRCKATTFWSTMQPSQGMNSTE